MRIMTQKDPFKTEMGIVLFLIVWVNWIQLVQPHLVAVDDVGVPQRGEGALGAAV
jgi:hypothetical protein